MYCGDVVVVNAWFRPSEFKSWRLGIYVFFKFNATIYSHSLCEGESYILFLKQGLMLQWPCCICI